MAVRNVFTERGRKIVDKIDEARRDLERTNPFIVDPRAKRAIELLADAVELLVLTTPDESLWTKEAD